MQGQSSCLLDRRSHGVGRAVLLRHEPPRVLAALARVGLPADAVHGQRQRGVRLQTDGAVRHGARAEAFHNRSGRLDLRSRTACRFAGCWTSFGPVIEALQWEIALQAVCDPNLKALRESMRCAYGQVFCTAHTVPSVS